MKKFAQVKRSNGECFHIMNIQSSYAYAEKQEGPENTFYTELPSDTDDSTFMSVKYWKDDQWHDRDPCPGDYYDWENEEWVFNNTFLWKDIKGQRNALLNSSDWSQMPDAPLTDEQKEVWRLYRQVLRDIPADQSDVTNPDQIGWPAPPS